MTAQSFAFEHHAIMIVGQFKAFGRWRLQRAAQMAQGARRSHEDQLVIQPGLGPKFQRVRDSLKKPRLGKFDDIFITSAMATEPEPIVDSGALTAFGLLGVFNMKRMFSQMPQGSAPPPFFIDIGLATIGRDDPSDFIHDLNLLT